MDTIKKAEELGFFNDEWNGASKINNNLTKKQAQNIIDFCILAVADNGDLIEDLIELKKYVRNGRI